MECNFLVETNYCEEHLQNYQPILSIGGNKWLTMDIEFYGYIMSTYFKQGTLHTRPAEFIGHPRCSESWHFDIVVPAASARTTSRT